MKATTRLFALLSAAALMAALGACSPSVSTPSAASVLETMASYRESMMEHKIPYVGDNSSVGKLLGFLPPIDENYRQNMFATQTQTEPYGLTIYYEPQDGKHRSDAPQPAQTLLNEYAQALFDNIENLGIVTFAYRPTPSNDTLDETAYQSLSTFDRPAE